MRYCLIPKDEESKEKLKELNGANSIVPLDCYLGIAGLPLKITPDAMLKISYWAQNQLSFKRAEDAIYEVLHVRLSDETIRTATNFVGNAIFENDCRKANEAYALFNSGRLVFPKDRKGVLYILTDGAALNTRLKDENGSTWRENKLGEVFSSNNIRYWIDKKGKRQHRILKKEYISYIGSANEFKKHLLACAFRGGYGHFEKTVILGDGATWIRNMAEEFFPDAQQILDYFHLCENVHIYAKYIFNMNESKYKPWANDICSRGSGSKKRKTYAKELKIKIRRFSHMLRPKPPYSSQARYLKAEDHPTSQTFSC